MPGSSNNSSFIPKRGTSKRTRKVRNLNIYILNILSYVVFFAALLAAAGVFFYSGYVREQMNNEVATMNSAIGNFKEADMQRVQEFDVRLRQANHRLNHSASVVRILEGIEENIIDTVRFESLSLTRDFDDNYVIEVTADTDTFDSSIFQRDTLLKKDELVKGLEVSEFTLRTLVSEEGQISGQTVSLVANILVPLTAVPYEPTVTPAVTTPAPSAPPVIESESTESETADTESTAETPLTENNQNDI